MRKKRHITILASLLMAMSLLAGCADSKLNTAADKIVGEWGYIHAPEQTVLSLEKDGGAAYQDKVYTYTYDDTFISLTGEENLRLRYKAEKDYLDVYVTTVYTYVGDGEPDGIAGTWRCEEKNFQFDFTADGTFREDTYFPGYYTIDKEQGTIKLVYNDQFEDTLVYYQVDGKTLTLEYPWRMIKVAE